MGSYFQEATTIVCTVYTLTELHEITYRRDLTEAKGRESVSYKGQNSLKENFVKTGVGVDEVQLKARPGLSLSIPVDNNSMIQVIFLGLNAVLRIKIDSWTN